MDVGFQYRQISGPKPKGAVEPSLSANQADNMGGEAVYIVTKTFVDGPCKDLTIEDRSPVSFEVGKTYGGGWTGSKYRVEACRKEG